ncbi:rho GTPase-activating protein 12 isoform X1 [Scophthalmus maximus]|uniref:rho GTPase-activating protein 12 isoform X1 n=1 Tax=Scophthalmus maximus TaxID=52904 RepID=UPI001FA8A8E6|nr:rho GTPase-activating protein 12 isoform X1 [Scophthalmus maximus]XP_035489522.2 rho GTPase-activating protein 12 isoform X1 [Scophthalmus maximus]
MAELPIAPGQVYIEVEYDYEYKSKDRLITIRQGESYMLVKKSNEDWWQVRKEEGSKAFYVPAQYVREVRKALMPPLKPIPHPPAAAGNAPPQSGGALWVKPTSLDLGLPDRPAENLHRHDSNYRRSPSAQTATSGHFSPPRLRRDSTHRHAPASPTDHDRALHDILVQGGVPQPAHRGGSLPRSRARSPEMARAPLDVDGTQHFDSAEEERPANDSESGDELSSSSTEHLQMVSSGRGRSESPVYTNLQELKITQGSLPPLPAGSPLHALGDWETHRDQSGRHFYYNRCTQERTWKPPRARDSTGNSRGDHHSAGDSSETTPLSLSPSFLPFLSLSIGRLQPLSSSEDTCFSAYSSRSDSRCGSPPPPPSGWSEETDEYGHTLYVSDRTHEKWLKHVDDQGRPYYYSADGSRSEWELPKYNLSPPQLPGEATKSRSLDRKHMEPIVLTKWRHSAYVQEPNDKRLLKTRRFRAGSARPHPYKHKDAPLGPVPPSPDSDSCPSSPKPPASPSEKCGVLNVTKITEHGKRVRKNWTSSWTVLHGSTLLFAKGQGGGTSWFGGSQSKPEFDVDLRGGSVEWASKDKSSKKNVIELKTRHGTELLIQSENEAVASDWYRALQDTISTHAWESDEAIEEDLPDSPGFEKHDKEKEQRDSKKGRAAMKSSSSVDASDNKKTRHKLKKFLTRRPTLQAVRDKGYIEDQVFGCSLSSLCHREGSSVPGFVTTCIDHVENSGLCVDGLYRVSGNLAVIQKLRFAINHDEKVNLSDGKWEDIHVTTGALKMYFRELPEPLFTYTLFHDFVGAIKISDYKQKVQSIKELVRQLPRPNHDTMQVLFKHLRKVIDHGEENRMTTQSVAIVFGPTLLRPETETWNMAVHMVYQNQIVELILLEYENFFGR